MKEMQIATFKKKGSYAKEEVPNYKNNYVVSPNCEVSPYEFKV